MVMNASVYDDLYGATRLPTMGVITLNVFSSERGAKKTMQLDPSMLVFDACKIIREKMALNDCNQNEYGLFRVEDDPTRCVWMENGRPLEHYLLRNQDNVEYRRKLRMLKVRMLDNAVKTIPVDESLPVQQIMLSVCSKIGIANYEEYSLVRDIPGQNGRSIVDLRVDKARTMDAYGGKGGEKIPLSGTLGRNKEKTMEKLRQKLQTDEELNWLDHGKTLREQGVTEDETLLLKRKFFYSDQNIDSRDPVQLNLLYVQCRDGILRGLHPVSKETACQLGALQCQVEYGDFPVNKPNFTIDGRDVLPKEYGKAKENEKRVVQMYKELSGSSELDAKSRYVHLCRGLNTYGVTFFLVKEKLKGKNKLVPRLLGVNKESVMRVDEKTKEVLKEWPLEQVRKWAPTPRSFTLDFGDYADGFYTVQTADGEKIAQLIAGYIDIILKKKQIRDHIGIEGDEGSTMLEDLVAPARATLVSHGQIGGGQYPRDGNIAMPGVLRSAASGYGINGAQYGAVSGQILAQEVTRSQRPRIEDPKDRAQRALIGTIEATIRAVEEAEEEVVREPEIELPKFPDDPASRRLIDDQIEVGKERVNERLAAMGAATAQVVQWTAVKEEYDDRVGTAVATIGSNMPEVGRDVRDLAALMPQQKRGDLIDATRKLCGAFGDFLTAVNPEHDEHRTTVLAAASRVGDYSRNVITTIEEETTIQTTFTDGLMQRAKDVASSTAQLVQRYLY